MGRSTRVDVWVSGLSTKVEGQVLFYTKVSARDKKGAEVEGDGKGETLATRVRGV